MTDTVREALRELIRLHDAGEVFVDGPDAQAFLATLARGYIALLHEDHGTEPLNANAAKFWLAISVALKTFEENEGIAAPIPEDRANKEKT